ncbi:hypothetical protein BH20BAC1_BH20BAC1_02150 [soil metagenome]
MKRRIFLKNAAVVSAVTILKPVMAPGPLLPYRSGSSDATKGVLR